MDHLTGWPCNTEHYRRASLHHRSFIGISLGKWHLEIGLVSVKDTQGSKEVWQDEIFIFLAVIHACLSPMAHCITNILSNAQVSDSFLLTSTVEQRKRTGLNSKPFSVEEKKVSSAAPLPTSTTAAAAAVLRFQFRTISRYAAKLAAEKRRWKSNTADSFQGSEKEIGEIIFPRWWKKFNAYWKVYWQDF